MSKKPFDPKKAKEQMKITHPKQVNLKDTESVLVVAPFNMEEFVLSIPAIGALKDSMPPIGKLTLLCTENIKHLAMACDSADNVLVHGLAGGLKTLSSVLKNKYDILINFNPDPKLAMMAALLSGAKAKVAYAPKDESKAFHKAYNLALHTIDHPQHRIVTYLNLVRFIGANSYDFNPKIRIPEAANEFAVKYLKDHDVDLDRPIIGIHPTLNDETKRWSFNKYSQLMDNLINKEGCTVLVFYHKDEKHMLDEFMHVTKNKGVAVNVHDHVKAAAISRFLSCFICNETDFMHLFSPFTNIVVIWGDSEPDDNKPSGTSDVLQASDGKADSVPVSRVMEHIRKYIGR